jgi:hypothetical protein
VAHTICAAESGSFETAKECFAVLALLCRFGQWERIFDAICAADAVIVHPTLGRFGDSRP